MDEIVAEGGGSDRFKTGADRSTNVESINFSEFLYEMTHCNDDTCLSDRIQFHRTYKEPARVF